MSADTPRSVSTVPLGAVAIRTMTFTRETIAAFADLIGDHAPVHFDETFAKEVGFSGCIVHGFLLGSVFSGMLGEQLPGPHSIINTLSLKLHRPAAVGETLEYRVAVEQISEAVGAVVLALTAKKAAGETVVSGKATCSFPRSGSRA